MSHRFERPSIFELATAAIVVYVVIQAIDSTAYDDSYFFKRYANNLLEHGTFAWNVADGPVHGLTSQVQMVLATVLRSLTQDYWIVACRWLAAITLFAASWWMSRPTGKVASGRGLAFVAVCSPLTLGTLHTGMETAAALAVLAWALTRASGRTLEAAAATLVVYLTRPDAALIVVVAWAVRQRSRPRELVRFGLLVAAGLVAAWLTFAAYYGTALPLSFHMKTHGLDAYDAHVVELGLAVKKLHASTFLAVVAPFWAIALGGVFVAVEGSEHAEARRRAIAWLLASALFVTYHLAMTNEIMGMKARFYLPAFVPSVMAAVVMWPVVSERVDWRIRGLAWLVWAGGVGLAYLRGWIASSADGFFLERVSAWEYAVIVAGVGVLAIRPRSPILPHALVAVCGVLMLVARPPRVSVVQIDRQILRQHAREVTTVRGIFDVERCLPDLATVYHSEMGVTGLVLPHARAVDLVGILSTGPVLDGEAFQTYCARDRPEVIFLPHRNYRTLNRNIRESACFRDYVRVVDRSSSPMHVRRDLAPEFLMCARRVWRWQKKRTRTRLRKLAASSAAPSRH